MLFKFSTLSLFLACVSALKIAGPERGLRGEPASLDFTIEEGDPAEIDLFLFATKSSLTYSVSKGIPLDPEDPQAFVIIPREVVPGIYQFVATKVDDESVKYANSNDILISS